MEHPNSHQHIANTETGPWFHISSERPEQRQSNPAMPGMVVLDLIHYITAALVFGYKFMVVYYSKITKNI